MALSERFEDFQVAGLLAHRATRDPSSPFLLTGSGPLTYAEIDSQAEAMAASIAHLGVGQGDRIALVLPSWPEFAVSVFAAAKLGAVIVPLNPRLTLPELRYMLRHSGAALAISGENVYGIDYLHLFEDLLVELPELQYLITVGEEDLWYDDRIFQWEDLISAGKGRDFTAPSVDRNDAFAILYTSGTTGKPKGVELTHGNLIHVAAETVEAVGLQAEDRVVGVTALFHVFGLGPGLIGTLLGGASLILQDEFGAKETLELVERHGATVHFGVPTLFATELREAERREVDLSSVRICLAAGAPTRDDLAREVEKRFGAPLLIAYSLTELGSTVALTRPTDPEGKKRHTVGRPVGGTEVKVIDESGAVLPVESVGELAVRGPGVTRGYHRQPRETQSAMDGEGYLKTGDLGMLDEEGYIHLVGRRTDVVIRGGFNVHPREVEDRLMAH
ncbi:MAG: AMP-binding protein, partial [Longimicrobiales bacterium]